MAEGKYCPVADLETVRARLRERHEELAERLKPHILFGEVTSDENGIFVHGHLDWTSSPCLTSAKFAIFENLSMSIVTLDNGELAIRLY